MEMTENADVAPESDNEDNANCSNTSPQHGRGAHKVAEFSNGDAPTETSVSLPHLDDNAVGNGPHHIQTTSASSNRPGADKTSGAVIPADASESENPPWKSGGGSVTNINSSTTQPARAQGGRRLTFADETGGALAEVNYSNRTHYSKQTGPSALGGTGRACCAIS